VGDGHLQLALEQLARMRGEFIDYRDLAERHLGTIYEGLLEHHLDLLTAPAQERRLLWMLDLLDDKGERHRTGSYYTPDYIVQYVVDQALHPVLDAAAVGKKSDAEKIEARGAEAGFDVVIGNPPYVRSEQVGELKRYLEVTYPSTYHGAADLYVYFYEQGLRLLRVGGRLSYIVTNKWLRAGYGEGLRQHFAKKAQVERIVDFGHAPILCPANSATKCAHLSRNMITLCHPLHCKHAASFLLRYSC
jgi:hypothetical protein